MTSRPQNAGLFQITVAVGVMISYFINYGIGLNTKLANSPAVLPFGCQLVAAGIMLIGLFTVKAPASNRRPCPRAREIESALAEEREARAGLGWREAFFGKGKCGCAHRRRGELVELQSAMDTRILSDLSSSPLPLPPPFSFSVTSSSLTLPPQVVATSIFVDSLGHKLSLFISAIGMGVFFIIGALLKESPPPAKSSVGMSCCFVSPSLRWRCETILIPLSLLRWLAVCGSAGGVRPYDRQREPWAPGPRVVAVERRGAEEADALSWGAGFPQYSPRSEAARFPSFSPAFLASLLLTCSSS
ncbi:hypothetical protein B0H13DRAFT_2326087 [Mycena leptocephala]|nr:hypothetical protein B0H13DRAFT_2326087 [Mycena leptocephala]